MLKQRHSSSGLSAKTLSRSKFVNKTVNQNHNVSTESGKQGKTLRYPVKNKSCLIPRHLAQSTQSHILNSNESNRYKTNNRNQPSQKMQSNVQNRHPNIQKNTAQMEYNMKQRVNLVESKLTQPQVNFRSSQLGNNQQQRLSYKPFLSVPSDECNVKGNILSRLSDLTENISSSQLIQKIPYEVQRTRGIKQQSISGNNINMCNNNTSIMMRQRVLQKSVKQSYLYKSMQLSKGLQEMHRFYICVNELKWVCEQVYLVIRKYNEQIVGFYQQYSIQNRHNNNDLENIQKQSEQLLKRFNQLEVVNGNNNRYGSVGQLVGFNLMSSNYGYNCVNNNMADKDNNNVNNNNNNNNNRDSKGIVNTGSQFYPKLEKSHINNFMKTQNYNNESPQYSNHLHSWSKLIDNIQQHPMQKHNNNHNIQYDKNHNNQHNNIYNHHHHPNNHTAPTNQQNKNTSISINTFQLTQANSPFKNKTLNQLIRLSQLRKTQFMQNYTNTENKQNLYHLNNSQYQNNQQNLMCNINQTNQKYNLKGKDIDSYCLNNINDNNNNRNNNINDINYNNNSRFTKKPTLFEVGLRHISPQKDPFDSIHLPHFSNNNNNNNNNPLSKQSQQQFDHNMISIQQRQQFIQQKQFYQQQLIRLNHIIQAANIQNIQIHKIMDNKFKQLEREKNCLKQQLQRKQQKFGDYQKCIYKLVERALNELVICGRLNNSMGYYDNDRENNIGYNRENSNQQVNAYSVDRKSYSMNNLCDVERRQLINNRDNTNNNNSNKNNNNNNNNSNKNNKNKNHKSVILQPMIMINNKSFFSMVDCLQQVFRLDSNSNANKQFIQCNNVSYKDRVNSQEFQYQKVNDNNNDNNKKSKKQKNKQSMQIFQSNHNTNNNHNNVKNYNRNNKFQQQQQSLLQQIHQLQTLKHQLQQQIIKQQKQFNLNNNNNNMIQQKRQSHIMSPSYYDQLTQVMFAQAVTIEDMLILNNSNDGQQQQQGDNNNYHGQY